MDPEWQAKGTCITNLKNFMESNFLSRVEGRGFHVEGEGTISRVTFFFPIFFLEKVIIDAINVIKTNKKNLTHSPLNRP